MELHKHTFALLACACVSSLSSAATVDVKFDSNIFSGSGYDNVTIKAADMGSRAVSAGRFQGTASNLVGFSPTIFVDGVNDVFTYCYDIYQHISGGWQVHYTIDINGESARTLDFLGAVNHVLNAGKQVKDPFAWLRPANAYQGAAIQLGIWESLYDDSSVWRLDAGKFTAKDLDANTAIWWKEFNDSLGSSDPLGGQCVMLLRSAEYQDMITGDPLSVPEPNSLALLSLSVVGLAYMRRRRQKNIPNSR